jgi:hypothetical protein
MKRKILTVAVVAVIGVLVCIGLGLYARTNAAPPRFINGTNLKLGAKYEPLHLYLYVDTTSTNKQPDYLLCDGNDDVVYRENAESNTIQTTHFENGFSVLQTRRDKGGKIIKRTVSYDDDSGRMEYTYLDEHGDGFWDFFLDHTKDTFYVRSNLCWVLKSEATNQP